MSDILTDGETPPEAWIQGYLDRQDGKPYVGREYVTLREREDYWEGWQVGEEDLKVGEEQ